ncbi:OLC1v1029441C1 [Oldenlandia corymbosa var. corymbosa]|uniref:OLC1v1029441C1 n=1 Tax=Oldenlandia corymbosa var. corymbosa TaxID=529605 RepID=A0AAV1CGZ5_OLDCO|nr:OLC1v1029441C1 [Oldenlandia corymbosa var. corymbosa]
MAIFTLLSPLRPLTTCKSIQTRVLSQRFHLSVTNCREPPKQITYGVSFDPKLTATLLGTASLALTTTLLGSSCAAAELPSVIASSLQFNEPANALSLPTWAVHVSSVVEWITAMVLVWQYGEKTGNESWKGLSWGMGTQSVTLSESVVRFVGWKAIFRGLRACVMVVS